MPKKLKKISFLLLISFLSLLFYSNSLAEKNDNLLATPSWWTIYSDEEFMKIRAVQENRFKQEKIFFEKVKKEKAKKESKKRLETLEQNFSAQIKNIENNLQNWTNKCKILTKKTYSSLNTQNYEIKTIKKSLGLDIRDYKDWYYYNSISNSCLESQNFFWKNWFETRAECTVCLWTENVNNSIKVVAKVEAPKTQIKFYSDQILGNIANNIIKNKNNNELLDLQERTKNLIKILKDENLNIKESTKINFLKLLEILDSKISENKEENYESLDDLFKLINNDELEENVEIEGPNAENYNDYEVEEEDDETGDDSTVDFLKSIFGDDL